ESAFSEAGWSGELAAPRRPASAAATAPSKQTTTMVIFILSSSSCWFAFEESGTARQGIWPRRRIMGAQYHRLIIAWSRHTTDIDAARRPEHSSQLSLSSVLRSCFYFAFAARAARYCSLLACWLCSIAGGEACGCLPPATEHRRPFDDGIQLRLGLAGCRWMPLDRIKAMRAAARLENSCREKRRRTRRLTKVDNAIGISRPGDGLCSDFKVATL
ncbi:hypothetical protein THAOC_32203, partial [Thalassiosira oceanica]